MVKKVDLTNKTEKMVNDTKENKKRLIELSEREIKVIRNLIWDKVESLVIEKDNLDDPEYDVIYHIKIDLLESLIEKYFYDSNEKSPAD